MSLIYDCFTFYNEVDMLRARLHELAQVVDRFVLVEATQTFQGKPKPLYFTQNKHLFEEYKDKIIHVTVDFPTTFKKRNTRDYNLNWAREFYQRDQIMRGLENAEADDLIIVSDVDEILSAEKLREALRIRRKYDLTIFEMPMYSFFVNRLAHCAQARAPDLRWLGPRMLELCKISTPQQMREAKLFKSKSLRGSVLDRFHAGLSNYLMFGIGCRPLLIKDSGWHFTSIGGWENWRNKVESYSHPEYKEIDSYKSEQAYIDRMLAITMPANIEDLPVYIRENKDRFPFFSQAQP